MTFPNIYTNLLGLIGNTPLIKLNNITTPGSATLWAKLEYINPSGSIKDRICLRMVNQAEEDNIIKPGKNTLIEATSGNTGIGLALICLIKGYNLILVIPDDATYETKQLLKVYGARIEFTPAAQGMIGAISRAEKLVQEIPDSFLLNQFSNINNPKAHSDTTAIEIINQTKGNIDAFVSSVSTGGTITGVGRYLKKYIQNIKIYAVEPFESAVISGDKPNRHDIRGIGQGFIPKNLDRYAYDDIIKVKSSDALMFTKYIAQKEGLLVGFSSGAVAYAATQIAGKLGNSKQIVAIFADSAERYLSTRFYNSN